MNDNPQRVARLKACRFPLYISQFIDGSRTLLKCDGTIMDIENEFWELHTDYGHWRSASETWQHVKKMRARLRDMIANRAPLELRAELVATVYGSAGA